MAIVMIFTIFYLFLCFASGFAAAFLCIILYSKYKFEEIKNYLYFLLTITFLVIIITTNFYYKSIFSLYSNTIYDFFFFNSLLIGVCLYVYTLPVFIYSIINKYLLKKKILISISLFPFILYIILNLIKLLFKLKINIVKFSLYFAEVLLIIIIFHLFCYILYSLKEIKNPLRKKVLILILIFILLYSPFALIDSFYDKFYSLIFKHLPDGFSFAAPYYFLWNLITLFLTGKFLLKTGFNKEKELSKEIVKKYKITNREKEIISFIIYGYSNKEISDKAFISMTTVKKHIYNLFLKTGAKNRVELINILKG